MLKNYIKSAWRSMLRNKAFSLINITGLSIGIAASVLLFIVVKYEMSYDTFQPNYERTYRIVSEDKYEKDLINNGGVPVPALKALRIEFPQLQFGALHSMVGSQITVPAANNATGTKYIEKKGIYFYDHQLFNIFKYDWLAGDANALKDPYTVVLDEATAGRYFGSWQQAVGKTVTLDNKIPLKVTGVLKNIPNNTNIPLHVLVSLETVKKYGDQYYYSDDWGSTSSNFNVFTVLPPNVKEADIQQALARFAKRIYDPMHLNAVKTHSLQPLSTIHFDRRYETYGDHIINKSTLVTLTLIGLFIILMACVNFINLSTALSVNRSKEVGIRKVMGGNRKQLFAQVMTETAAIVFISILIAAGIIYIALPYIRHIALIKESLQLFTLQNIALVLGIGVIVTLLAGLYPSFVLSKFNPITALKNKLASANVRGVSLRRGLVVMQFTISQVLIIATAVAISQMNFISKAELGFSKEGVLVLATTGDSTVVSRHTAFKQQLLQIPGVQSVSFNSDVPSSSNNWSTAFAYNHGPKENFHISLKFADADYFKTFGLQMIAGRAINPSDTMQEIVLNETLLKKLGVKNAEEAVGKEMRISGRWYPIVGVVKDFKNKSLREEISPIVITSAYNYYYNTAIKFRTHQLNATKAAVEKAWIQRYPEYAFNPSFFDEDITAFYEQEEQLSLLYKIFAGLAIFISCLGLYGLVSFMAVQKKKEVGIRKVLGASIASLLQLFSKEFTVLIGISFLLAVPLAWYLMHSWLNNFAYRIPLSAWFFLAAIVGSLLIAWITVGYKAMRAALANPVKSLRSE